MKCYHFTVTNCHRLCYSLDVTCTSSHRNLCVNCSIITTSLSLSFSLSLSIFYLVHTNIHTILYNNNSGMDCNFVRTTMTQEEMWIHTRTKAWSNIQYLKSSNSTANLMHRLCQYSFPRVPCYLMMFDNVYICKKSKLFYFSAHLQKTPAK